MKVIFLNCWYGKAGQAFFDFVNTHAADTDIFCFQETSPEINQKLLKTHTDFKSFVATNNEIDPYIGEIYCQTVFVKKDINVVNSGKFDLFKQLPDDVGFLQHLKLTRGDTSFFIGNVHGKARPGDKLDTRERISQSQKIIEFFEGKTPAIIGGDFNLKPETKSAEMFEKNGYKNLIKIFGVKNTRNRFAWEQYANGPGGEKQFYADFCFVSPQVKVKGFEVPENEVSDHLPLILDFEL